MALGTIIEWKQMFESNFDGDPTTSELPMTIMRYSQQITQQQGHKRFECPVKLELYFRLKRTKSLPKKKEIPHTTHPIITKLSETVINALDLYFLKKESSVIDLRATKRYALKNESPGCRIVISTKHEVRI